MSMLSRTQILSRLADSYADIEALRTLLAAAELPKPLADWLGRLKLLYGVPIHYLVPDERMLPPESIRFFYLDSNWIDALVDGAFSIGRNLTKKGTSASIQVDRAVSDTVDRHSALASCAIRSDGLGLEAPQVSLQTISGFLLRSSVVSAYPGLGVSGYPEGGTPNDPKITPLDIVRMERLGPQSDTLICMFAGDAVRVDIHEAPEALHYGIDDFSATTASKKIRLFTKSGNNVTISKTQVTLDLMAGKCFRPNSRVMKMSTLAGMIAGAQQPAIPSIGAAEMGFEMTEGVGSVSFERKGTNQ